MDYPLEGLTMGVALGLLILTGLFSLGPRARLVGLGIGLAVAAYAGVLRIPDINGAPTAQLLLALAAPALAVVGLALGRSWSVSASLGVATSAAWLSAGSYTSSQGWSYGWVLQKLVGPPDDASSFLVGQFLPLILTTVAAVAVFGTLSTRALEHLDPVARNAPVRMRAYHLAVGALTFSLMVLLFRMAEHLDGHVGSALPARLAYLAAGLGAVVVLAWRRRVLGVVLMVPAALCLLYADASVIGWSALMPLENGQISWPPRTPIWQTTWFLAPAAICLVCALVWLPSLLRFAFAPSAKKRVE